MKKIIAIFLLYFLYFQFVLAESENMIDFMSTMCYNPDVYKTTFDLSFSTIEVRYGDHSGIV